MIISRTPYRISFFGGGTDYKEYYLKHGGKTLGVAINKYSYLNIRRLPPFFEYKHRIVYSKQENVIDLDDLMHPSVRETLKYFDPDYGVSIHHDGDIPPRSGMGSSSAFTVGLVNGMYALNGRAISKHNLALTAIHIEQDLIKENVGSQDQIFAAHGGLNLIEFHQNGEINVKPVIMDLKRRREFEDNILLFFSGLSRTASEVVEEQIKNTEINISSLNTMKELVDEAYSILTEPDRRLGEFGELLNDTWNLKKRLSSRITNTRIDMMYEKALAAGALGGKLLGAGGGGFMAFYVEKEHQESVKEAMKEYLHIPFKFDFDGSKIIVYEPNYEVK